MIFLSIPTASTRRIGAKDRGKKGERLGIENNPQVEKMSGENYYLQLLVEIP